MGRREFRALPVADDPAGQHAVRTLRRHITTKPLGRRRCVGHATRPDRAAGKARSAVRDVSSQRREGDRRPGEMGFRQILDVSSRCRTATRLGRSQTSRSALAAIPLEGPEFPLARLAAASGTGGVAQHDRLGAAGGLASNIDVHSHLRAVEAREWFHRTHAGFGPGTIAGRVADPETPRPACWWRHPGRL